MVEAWHLIRKGQAVDDINKEPLQPSKFHLVEASKPGVKVTLVSTLTLFPRGGSVMTSLTGAGPENHHLASLL